MTIKPLADRVVVKAVEMEETKSTEERIGTIAVTVVAFAAGFAAMNLMKKRK